MLQKSKIAAGTALAALSTLSLSAYAALPESVATTATSIQTDGKAMFDAVFPVIGAIVGLVVVIKLFKRFINKV